MNTNLSSCAVLKSSHFLAVKLNNVSSILIRGNELQLAIQILGSALECLTSSWSAQSGRTASGGLAERIKLSSTHLSYIASHGSKHFLADDEVYSPLIYAHPLIIYAQSENPEQSLRLFSLEELSTIILFNLALAHHLAGERWGVHYYIDRAVTFYKFCEMMLTKIVETGSTSVECPQHLVTAAKGVLNNMGQICLQWEGNHVLGREFFKKLEHLYHPQGIGINTGTVQFDAFLMNVFVMRGMNQAPAA